MSEEEVASQVETACTKASAFSVWLPEHLQKSHESVDEGEAIIQDAAEEFRSSLESLDPPADLRKPIERLASTESEESASSLAATRAALKRRAALYEEVGADRCSRSTKASLLTLDGASVEAAYRRVGLPLPPRPDGW
jgi:hypothetical protein